MTPIEDAGFSFVKLSSETGSDEGIYHPLSAEL